MFKTKISFFMGAVIFAFVTDFGMAKILTDCACYNCTSGGEGCSPDCYQQCVDTTTSPRGGKLDAVSEKNTS